MVSESYQSEGFGLMSMGNRGRLARNQNSEFTMEEERAYRHGKAHCTWLDRKVNGHEDKQSSDLFKYKWYKQQNCTNSVTK